MKPQVVQEPWKDRIKGWVIVIIISALFYFAYDYIKSFVFPSKERQEQLNSHKYPDAFKFSWMNKCTLSANKKQCQCALDYYQSKYTYAEYVRVGREENVIAEMRNYCLPK